MTLSGHKYATYDIQRSVTEQKTKTVWDFQSTDWRNFITDFIRKS